MKVNQPPSVLYIPSKRAADHIAQYFTDNDFIVDFENHTYLYTLVVLLHNRRALGWKECQALVDVIKIAACGTAIDNASFKSLCADLEKKYGAVTGPVLRNGRFITVLIPGPGDVNSTTGDLIAHVSLTFDADGDLVVTAHTYSHNKYKVVLSLPTTDHRLFRRDCQALIDVLFHLETGDRVDNVHFLYTVALLRRDHNFVRLFENTPFSIGTLVTASAVRNTNPLPQALADAFARKQTMTGATQQPPSPAPSTGLPTCPYPGIRYVRALAASGQAQVYEAVRENGERVAVKVFSGGASEAGQTYRTELRMLLKMREHRNVIGVIDFFETPAPALVMRFITGAGDLAAYLSKNGRMSEELAVRIAAELAAGIAYLHSAGVVHRDLKSANVLLRTDSSGELSPVIIDLGLGSTLKKPAAGGAHTTTATLHAASDLSSQTGSVKGSLYWMAPEMVTHQQWSEKSDVYAFAVILWELLCASTPYAHLQVTGVIDLLLKVAGGARPDMREVAGASPAIKALIERCWAADPRERPTMMQVVDQLRGNDPVAIFKSMDRDGNSALDFGEFVQFLLRFAPHVLPGEMPVIFAAIDEDSSGTITLPEFLKFWNVVQRKGLPSALTLCQRTRNRTSFS